MRLQLHSELLGAIRIDNTYMQMNYYFVTGSSKGIGLALVKALLEQGESYVVGLSRNNDLVHERFRHFSVDLSDVGRLKKQVNEFFEVPEVPDRVILINNAGMLGEVGYLGEIETESIPDVYNLNLVAPAMLMNAFIKEFAATSAESMIVNISSGAGGYPVDGWSGYCATKAGINMLSQVVATERGIRGDQVKIFSLAPGIVDTGMQEKIRSSQKGQFSGVEKFIGYKENAELASSEKVAEKIMVLLDQPEKFKDVMLDVRQF